MNIDEEQAPNPSGSFLTLFSHRGFTLISTAYVLFGVPFIVLYSSSFWFSVDLLPWGIPTAVAVVVLSHVLLTWQESPFVCRLTRVLLKGRPLVVYRRWLSIDERGITYAAKHIQWQAVDKVDLTIWGNLVFKSRSICGPAVLDGVKDLNPSEPILKIPFGVVSQRVQKAFFEILAARRPDAQLDERLCKQLANKILPKVQWVQSIGVIFLAAIIVDLGYSTFSYLETLKHYYLSRELAAHADTTHDAMSHFAKAEWLRSHPVAISWIAHNVFSEGPIAASFEQARSEALWELGYKQEAIDAEKKAALFSPRAFRFHLRLARLYCELHNDSLAADEINKAISSRQETLLPRMYMLAHLLENDRHHAANEFYDNYNKELGKSFFPNGAVWPPGGEPFIHDDHWYQEDLDFVFPRILKISPYDKIERKS